MNVRHACATLALVVIAGGCGEPTIMPVPPQITLSAAQAATVIARIQQISVAAPELSWLVDSANVVLAAGAEIDSVPIVTTRTTAQFYAVGLERRFPGTSSSFSTFTFIAFDSPDSPTDFVVVDGYQSTGGTNAPLSMAGTFGLGNVQQLSGYVFHVAGSTVTEWRASASGSAALASASGPESGNPCSQPTSGATCTRDELMTSFSMDAGADTVGATVTPRTASMAASTVAAVALTFPVH